MQISQQHRAEEKSLIRPVLRSVLRAMRREIIFRHAIFPLKKVSDRLRLDAYFGPVADWREEQVHLI